MANVKITELSAIANPASTDVLAIVDLTADITKKVTIADLLENAGDGTAAAPAFSFDSDTNTGVFLEAADKLGFSTNGTGRIYIDATGNVGIAKSNPTQTLDVNGTAAVSGALTQGGNNVVTVGDTGTVTSTMIADGTIVDADVNASAAIGLSKLATGALPTGITVASANIVDGTIVDADVNASAAIGLSKLATGALPTGITVASANIVDGTIVNADVSATAEIAVSKLANGTARQLLQTDAAGTGVEFTSNVDVPGTLDVTGVATFDDNVTVGGNLTVNGTTTTIDSTTLVVEDKNIEMGAVTTPSDTTADGGGITLKGATDKTLTWVNSTDCWTFNQALNLTAGTESAPALVFDADVNTGIYHPAADALAISTNGTERLRIDSSGNVGINHQNPLSPLHILGDSDTTNTGATLLIDDSATTGADVGGTVAFRGSDGSIQRTYGLIKGGKTSSGANFDGYLSFQTRVNGQSNTTEQVRIDSSGNVGIGTNSPAQALDIVGSVKSSNQFIGPTAALGSSATNPTYSFSGQQTGMFLAASNEIGFSTGGSEKVRITSSGNVGIGTSSPNNLLDVQGASNPQIKVSATNTGTNSAGLYIENQGQRNWQIWADRSSDQLRIGHNGRASTVVSVTDTSVGLGVAAPTSTLHLQKDTGSIINLGTGTTTASSTQGFNFYGRFISGTTPAAPGQLTSFIREERQGSNAQFDLVFGTSFSSDATEKMRLRAGGLLGIGTSSPIAKLTSLGINSGGEGGNLCIQNTGSGVNTNVALYLTPNNGGGNDLQRTAAIKSRQEVSGNFANLEFYTSNSGTPTERVRIDSSGNFFTGGTNSISAIEAGTQSGKVFKTNHAASSGSTSTGQSFHFSFANPNGFVGSISTSGSGTAFNTSSDHRLKENVVDLDGAIDRVKQLAPKRFNFIADADTTLDGFLAHEAQAVVPEAVTGTHNEVDDDGNPVMQGIDQAKLVPLLTAALKEAIAKIETLEQRLTNAGL